MRRVAARGRVAVCARRAAALILRVRIAVMPSARIFMAAAVMAVVALAALACGSDAPDTPAPAATAIPTATAAPSAGTSTSGDAAAQTPPTVPSVPHRDYNALGAADAPIVVYDYSDFV